MGQCWGFYACILVGFDVGLYFCSVAERDAFLAAAIGAIVGWLGSNTVLRGVRLGTGKRYVCLSSGRVLCQYVHSELVNYL